MPIKALGLVALCLGYPFLTSWLVGHGWGRWILLGFAVLSVRRCMGSSRPLQGLSYASLALLFGLGAFFAETFTARMLPGLAYFSAAMLFGFTLSHPPSLIERMVRLQFPEFEPGIADYLRQLTGLWTIFFAANVLICVVLAALADEKAWTLYTGVIVWVLMGILVCGEMLYRPRRFPDMEMPRVLDSFKILMRDGHKVFRELRQ